MLGLNRLASTLRGGAWLVRCGGLRQRLEQLEQRAASLERLEQQRWSELNGRLETLVNELGMLAGRVAPLVDIDQRTAQQAHLAGLRWDELGSRLGAFADDVRQSDARAELRLSG